MSPAVVGIELAKVRKVAGLTQAEVARRMGTSQPAIARAESGWISIPSIEWLSRYAKAVGRPLLLTIGGGADLAELERRAERVLGPDFEQNPWERDPTQAEARALTARGLTRERFRRRRTTAA